MREAFFKMGDPGIWSLVFRETIGEGSKNRVSQEGWCREDSREQERWREPPRRGKGENRLWLQAETQVGGLTGEIAGAPCPQRA